jgi:ABC-2 type transport system permease protein
VLTLIRRSLGRSVWLFVSIFAVLVGFQLALIAVAASIASRGDFARLAQLMPSFVQDVFGPGLRSFAGAVTLGYFEPLPVMVVVLISVYVATEAAGEIESGLVDLLLARPLPRHSLLTRSFLTIVVVTLSLMLAMGLATWAGLTWLAPDGERWPSATDVGMLMIHLIALAWCFGALTLAGVGWAKRRGAIFALVGISVVALYLLDTLEDAWRPLRTIMVFSPFHYFPGSAVLEGSANATLNLSVLASITTGAVVVAYWQFGRRDL